MSQSEAGPARRRAKYAPRACNVCRRRKCKCDGAYPVCQPCTVSGYECSWVPEGDEDRPATKQLVEGLRAKVQLLEAEIAQLKQGAPATTSSSGARPDAEFSSTVPKPVVPSGSLSHVDNDPNASGVRVEHALSRSRYQPRAGQVYPSGVPAPLSSNLHIIPTTDQRPTSPKYNMAASIGMQPALTYQYISNIDTSLPLEEQPPEHRASLECQWNRYLPDLGAAQLSRLQHDTLLTRCFSYGAAWLFGLLPDLFLRDMLEYLSPGSTRVPGELQHYTPLLHCSLLAFASPLSDDVDIQQPSTREKFAAHAKQWLDEEFTYANPSLILSLILLSEYHMGVGEKNTGYMYTGMSIRAVRAGTGSLLRDWYRWSAYVQEKLMAQEMERPSEMPVPTTLIAPPITLELSGQPPTASSITSLFDGGNYSGIAVECFIQCTKLMLITAAVTPSGLQLDSWFNALPESLDIRPPETMTPPPILALHIRYWWSILRLDLPNSASASSQPLNLAAHKMVELFRVFDTQFGFQYFPRNLLKAVHVCGRMLIHVQSPGDWIDICLKALRTWSCAELMLQDLVELRVSMESVNGIGAP